MTNKDPLMNQGLSKPGEEGTILIMPHYGKIDLLMKRYFSLLVYSPVSNANLVVIFNLAMNLNVVIQYDDK